jgi:hypothetical protein
MISRERVLIFIRENQESDGGYSGVCRSTDSEAMNIVEVIDEVKEICGDKVCIYTGNGHTTTKISAGMAFLSHGVIAGGRIHYEPTWNLEEGAISRLRNNVMLLNKVGKLLRGAGQEWNRMKLNCC